MKGNLIIKNANIITPLGSSASKGSRMGEIYTRQNSYIVCQEGKITKIDNMENLEDWLTSDTSGIVYHIYDAKERCVLPGFVDSHTHLIFGDFRPDEFGWRLKGDTYMSIMERGGGIQSTVDATRKASFEELKSKALWFIDAMSKMGVTTVEAKSGYGLDVETEQKMLEVIDSIRKDPESKVSVVSTFLGAHAVPKEYAGRTAEYVDLIINEMLPRFKNLAQNCDVFCEKNVFEIEDTRRLMKAAEKAGYSLKLHADEIVQLGGGELAAELHALSADHLLHVSDEGVRKMAENDVVATLLPLTAFALKEPYAPARKFIEAGGAVALATDLNPGSCFSGSIPLTIALACIYMNMSIEETITALTLNGAAAIGLAESKGSIEVGKEADFAVLVSPNYHVLPYYVGMNCVLHTIKGGVVLR